MTTIDLIIRPLWPILVRFQPIVSHDCESSNFSHWFKPIFDSIVDSADKIILHPWTDMFTSEDRSGDLEKVQAVINKETFLRISVLDVQNYDGTLVVMTDHNVPQKFTRHIMDMVWNGPVEVYCASTLMTGADTASS